MRLCKEKIVAATLTVLLVVLMVQLASAATVTNLVVKVVDSDGDVVSGAVVEIYDSDGTKVFSGTTDDNGTVTISSIETGTYDIYVYYNRKLYHFSEEISDSTSEIELKLTYARQFTAALYSYWWIFALIGGGVLVLMWIMIAPKGRRGAVPASLFVFLLLIGVGMATTAVLVMKAIIDAETAAVLNLIKRELKDF